MRYTLFMWPLTLSYLMFLKNLTMEILFRLNHLQRWLQNEIHVNLSITTGITQSLVLGALSYSNFINEVNDFKKSTQQITFEIKR